MKNSIENMYTIDILIATFNGAKYLRQQLLSILAQDYPHWRALLHDDGSTDTTLQIIQEFCNKDNRFTFIDDGLTFKSPALNFMHLLRMSTNEYICFCDQDDVWIENKLTILLDNFKQTDIPKTLVSSSYLFTNDNNCILGLLDYQVLNLSELLFINGGIHGNRCMLNSAMREEMIRYQGHINMHDHLMSQIACSFGEISYIKIPLSFYRQHSTNVTGNIITSPLKRIFKAFTSIPAKFLISREIYECNRTFMANFSAKISESDYELINAYLRYPELNVFQRIITLLRFKFSIGTRGRCHLFIKALTRKCFDR